ncbi:hypothetical protein CBS470a_012749 [Colletotrichum nupharicola]|nr:hypothetical protein CBS470a_012749 [Colletotrichum nupharicola]
MSQLVVHVLKLAYLKQEKLFEQVLEYSLLQQFYRIIIITLKLHPHFLILFVIIFLPLVDVNFVVFHEFEHPFGKQFRPAIVQQYAIKISYHLRPVTN